MNPKMNGAIMAAALFAGVRDDLGEWDGTPHERRRDMSPATVRTRTKNRAKNKAARVARKASRGKR